MVGSPLRHWVDCGQPGATPEIYAAIGHRVGHPAHCNQCEWDHAGTRRQVPPRQGVGRRRLKYSLFLTGPLSRFHANRERVWADIAGPWDSRSLPVGGFYRLGFYSTNCISKRSWSFGRRLAWFTAGSYFATGLIGIGLLTSIPQTCLLLLTTGWIAAPRDRQTSACQAPETQPQSGTAIPVWQYDQRL